MTCTPASSAPFDPKAFLIPAETASLPNAFFIGPYGRRVSFASQQRRALNTVWAMEQADCFSAGDRVAVIGAGLAGVMATVALAARGARVTLYEAESKALALQTLTNHRWVHPSLNFWPEEPLVPSTEFPFFDWAAGVVDDIIRFIGVEWTEIRKALTTSGRLQKFLPNTEVTGIVRSPGGLTVDVAKHPNRGGTFKAVLITTGFGEEKAVLNTQTKSYWEQDDVEALVRDSDRKDFLISGTGDGGLIDTLRLLHRNFDTGLLCLQVAQSLSEAGASAPLTLIEQQAREAYGLAEAASPTTGAQAAAPVYAEAVSGYISGKMPDGVLALLDSSLINDRSRGLLLVGPLSQPYSLNAAPIHKLMVAHALQKQVLNYEQGSVAPCDDHLQITTAATAKAVQPEYAIARHGSNLPVERFIPDEAERNALKRRQEEASDWLRTDVVPRNYFAASSYPPHDPLHQEFITSRYERAESFVKDFANGHLEPRVRPSGYRAGPRPNGPFDSTKVPPSLFGISIQVKEKRRRVKSAVARAGK